MLKWTEHQLLEYKQRTKAIYKLFLQIFCEEFSVVNMFDNINRRGNGLINETIPPTDLDLEKEGDGISLNEDISMRIADDFIDDLCSGFPIEYNFEYDPESPEGAALIHILHVCIQHIISTKRKLIGSSLYNERDFLNEFRPLLLFPKKGPYRKKANPLQERRYSRLREQIRNEFKEQMADNVLTAFDQTLQLVISRPSKPKWLKEEYAKYRKHKIWYKFVKQVDHSTFVNKISEPTEKDLFEDKYPCMIDGKIHPKTWGAYLYKDGKPRISFAERMGFLEIPEFLEYAKKYRNTRDFRKGFIKYLLSELWPNKSQEQIIELLK